MLGPVGEGWKVAMATLGHERGTAFLSQQLAFEHEFSELLDVARKRGVSDDPVLRDELADRYVGLQVMRFNGMRMLTNMLQAGRSSAPKRASASCSGRPGTAASARPQWT